MFPHIPAPAEVKKLSFHKLEDENWCKNPGSRMPVYSFVKRLMDIVLSALALVLFAPFWILLIYAAAGLAFLTKGVIGPVLLAGPIVAAVMVGKRWDVLRSWIHVPGMGVFLVLCLVWRIQFSFLSNQ